jgi:hypothetical protein
MPRSFNLNGDEAYEAVCEPRERAWIPNGALPREPRAWEREVLRAEQVRGTGEQRKVEPRRGKR